MSNGRVIEAEIAWAARVMDLRFRIHAGEAEAAVGGDVLDRLPPPRLPRADAPPYARAIREARLSRAERLVAILAILPHLRPQALDALLIRNHVSERRFTEFGGVRDGPHSGFRPTRETAYFLIAGEVMEARLGALALFEPDGALAQVIVAPDDPDAAGPWCPLVVDDRWIARVTTGRPPAPRFGAAFPARVLETAYTLADLVLDAGVRAEIDDILAWVRHEAVLMADWGLARHVKPGYRALFHGPPGTGKTMTAAVLGRELGRPVFRVDLSRVVSKYIGETEKNLGALFDRAAAGEMILFFDEADALFGKRGDTRTANDRHANQQIAYLLQRVEDSPGLVILASNLRGNIDAAFARRFQSMVYFPVPDAAARAALWRSVLSHPGVPLASDVDLARLARDHVVAGGAIINVLRHCCIAALGAGSAITHAMLEAGIRRERENMGEIAS